MAKKVITTPEYGYYFNIDLFLDIFSYSSARRSRTMYALGIAPSTWRRWESSKTLPIRKLIMICEHLHVPVSRFITYVGEEERENILDWTSDTFAPIEYKPNSFGEWITKGRNRSVDQACADIGSTPKFYYEHFKSKEMSNLRIDRYLIICNRLRVWPGSWLIDNNEPIPLVDGFEKIKYAPTEEALNDPSNPDVQRDPIEVEAVLDSRAEIIEAYEAEIARLKALLAERNYTTRAAED